MTRPWRPLLEGALRDRALATVDAIGRDILERLPTGPRARNAYDDLGSSTLAWGAAGLLLFAGYARALTDKEWAVEAVDRITDLVIAAFPDTPPLPGLFVGTTGLPWVLDHLQGHLGITLVDTGDDIDFMVRRFLEQPRWPNGYDLITGLAGVGAYALQRLQLGRADLDLGLIVERLKNLATTRDGCAIWQTKRSDPWAAQHGTSEIFVDIGVAHGIVGALAMCARLSAREQPEDGHAFVRGGIDWLIRHGIETEHGISFATEVSTEAQLTPCRIGWCYGDLGIASALYPVAHVLGSQMLADFSLNLALRSFARSVVDAELVDGS